jgi:hypothetical protein
MRSEQDKMDELVKLVEEIYFRGSKDHSDQTKDSMEKYFDIMVRKIMGSKDADFSRL